MAGILHFNTLKATGEMKQSSWYDEYEHTIEFSGEFNSGAIHNVLFKRLGNQFLSKFGGQTSITNVRKLDDKTVVFTKLFHIGD